MNTLDLARSYLNHNAAESGADELIRALVAVVEQQQTALKYGRDCVMESFEHVKDTDDQVMADARLRAIDAAMIGQSSEMRPSEVGRLRFALHSIAYGTDLIPAPSLDQCINIARNTLNDGTMPAPTETT